MEKIKMILLSEQAVQRKALACLFAGLPDLEVVAETPCHREALHLAAQLKPSVLLADVDLSGNAVPETAHHLNTHLPSVNLVFFGSPASKKRLVEAVSLGARGYLTTDLTPEEFTCFLRECSAGRPAISPSILAEVLQEMSGLLKKKSAPGQARELTPREKEVLRQLASGATNREIARSLVISEYTVKNHIHNMLDKLHIQNRTQLISYAISNGLLAGLLLCCSEINSFHKIFHLCLQAHL